MSSSTWIVVLIKDFGAAKTRLASVLAPEARRTLAVANARRALDSAMQVAPSLAVCGSTEAAETATACGAEVIVEGSPGGQNAAARLGLAATALHVLQRWPDRSPSPRPRWDVTGPTRCTSGR